MTFSWSVIVVINTTWTLCLILRRKSDHPALAPFFATYTVSDSIMFVAYPASYGGLELIPLSRDAWVVLGMLCWLSWFIIIPMVALILLHGKFKMRWLFFFGVPAVLLSCSELFGFSSIERRQMAHWGFEPAVLLCGAFATIRYLHREARSGRLFIDIKSFYMAAALTFVGAMMFLKLLLLLDSRLNIHQSISHAIYYTLMSFVVVTYFALPRYRRWLLRM